MSRSLTKLLKLENEMSVGIAFSKSNICSVILNGESDRQKMHWSRSDCLKSPMFVPERDENVDDLIYETLTPLADELRNKLSPVHVVIPDHAMHTATFELDELPKSKKVLASLARWRMSNETGRPENDLECQMEVLGRDGDKHLLYAQTVENYWLEKIRNSLRAHEIIPWTINSASWFRYNRLDDMGFTESSAILSMDNDCWTLQILDEKKRHRLTVTRLRGSSQCADEVTSISNELTRVIRAWYMKRPNSRINKLYLDGCREGVAILSGMVQSELFEQIVTIDNINFNTGVEFDNQSSQMSLAIMAAISS